MYISIHLLNISLIIFSLIIIIISFIFKVPFPSSRSLMLTSQMNTVKGLSTGLFVFLNQKKPINHLGQYFVIF